MTIHGWPSLFVTLLLVFLPAKGSTETDENTLLSTALVTSDRLDFQQPDVNAVEHNIHGHHFSSLNDAILFYEGLQYSGLWRPLEAGPLLQYGDRHAQVSRLKGQLRLLGDLPQQDIFQLASQYFDQDLMAALIRFQVRHSVKADGILGPQTRRLLNVPPWQRVDQLALNINRQRQL